MQISQRTVGLLIEYVEGATSQATLGGLLKRHNLGNADPGVDNRRFSSMSKAKRADKALSAAFTSEKEDDLIDLAVTALRDQDGSASAPEWVRDLLASLRADGFSCTPSTTTVPATSSWASPTTETRWAITPLGYTALPVSALSSDLADKLRTAGFPVAASHYDQALDAFLGRNWAASNSQLRTTFEAVLLELAGMHTGTTPSGGGSAIDALKKQGILDYGPDAYIRGLWKLSHPGGSHPGLSNEEDAHHRMYAISAMVGWLVRSYT